MLNHEKIKELGIKPERVRQLIREIEGQGINANALKSGDWFKC